MKDWSIIIGILLIVFLIFSKKSKTLKKTRKNLSYQESVWNFETEGKFDFKNERIKQIINTDFKLAPLMNKAEYLLFLFLEKLLEEKHKKQKYRLFTQVGLGGFIRPPKELANCTKEEVDAFWSINHLRADFVIIDRFGRVTLVIEYHGSKHWIDNPTDRDTRKRYACKKVGVELFEIIDSPKDSDAEKISLLLNTHYMKITEKFINKNE